MNPRRLNDAAGDDVFANEVDEFHPVLDRFDQAWSESPSSPPQIRSYLDHSPNVNETQRRALLVELIKIDLEYRWRERQVNESVPRLCDYQREYPELENLPLELIEEEYWARSHWGDEPQAADYLAAYPQYEASLLERLSRLDRIKQAESWSAANAPAPTSSELPDVPEYQILGRIGRGGMGEVFLAHQVSLNRRVAIKVIRSDSQTNTQDVCRLVAEAQAAASLRHPNIVQIYAVHDGDPTYCVMEFIEGGNLAEHLDGTPFEAEAAASVVETLADAVRVAHRNGIVHRDLKPGNVLLAKSDHPASVDLVRPGEPSSRYEIKIADFGLAKQIDERANVAEHHDMMAGTPCYMAPEQVGGNSAEIGPVTDVYALGAILYELLTGRPPFQMGTTLETLQQVVTALPEPIRELNSNVPRDLETICFKCLEKDPTARYESAWALACDLRRFRNFEPIQARCTGKTERLARWIRRRPFMSTSAAILLAMLTLLVVGGVRYHTRLQAELEHSDYQRRRAHENASQALFSMQDLVDQLVTPELSMLPAAASARRSVLEGAIELSEDTLENLEVPDPILKRRQAELYRRVALAYLEQKDFRQATHSAQRAVRINTQLGFEVPRARKDLARAYLTYGLVEAIRDPSETALAHYRKSLALLESQTSTEEVRAACALAWMHMGHLYREQGKIFLASESFEHAYRMRTHLVREFPDQLQHQADLGHTRYLMGQIHSWQGDLRRSEDAFRQTVRDFEKLEAQNSRGELYLAEAAYSWKLLGLNLLEQHRHIEAARCLRQATRRYERLCDEFPYRRAHHHGLDDCNVHLASALSHF